MVVKIPDKKPEEKEEHSEPEFEYVRVG